MSNNEAKVSITADASGVKTGTSEASAAIRAMGEAAKSIAAGMAASFSGVQTSIKEVAASTREATEAMKGSFETVGHAIEAMNRAFMAVTAAMAGGAVFHEVIADTNKLDAENAKLAKSMGISLEQASGLHATLNKLGIGADEVIEATMRMTRQLVRNEGAFKAQGIATRDAEGHWRSSLDVLTDSVERLNELKTGIDRTATAQELFGGRSGDLGAIMKLTNEQIEDGARVAKELGLVTTSDGVAAMREYGESIREMKEVFEAVTIQIGRAVRPALIELGNWFRENGAAAIQSFRAVLNDVINVFKSVADIVDFVSEHWVGFLSIATAIAGYLAGPYVAATITATVNTVLLSDAAVGLAAAFSMDGIVGALTLALEMFTGTAAAAATSAWALTTALLANPFTWVAVAVAGAVAALDNLVSHAKSTKDAFAVLKDNALIVFEAIKGAVVEAVNVIILEFKLAWDVINGNWSKIEGDWQTGLDVIEAQARSTSRRISALWDDTATHMKAAVNPNAGMGGKDFGIAGGWEDKPLDRNDQIGKPPKAPKEKDNIVQTLEAELTADKVKWAKKQDAQGTAQEYSLQSEADYWRKAQDLSGLSVKDRLAIDQKYLAASQALTKDRITKQIDAYKNEIEEAGANSAKKLQILDQEKSYIIKTFGAESKEAAAAEIAITKAKQDATKQRIQLAEMEADAEKQLALHKVEMAQSASQFEVQMGRKTQGQALAEERSFEIQRYNIESSSLEARKRLVDKNKDPVQFKQIATQIEALEQQHQTKLTQIDQKATLERTQYARQAIQGIAQTMADSMVKLVTFQQSFAETMKNLWKGITSAILGALTQMLASYLAQQIATLVLGKAAQSTTGLAQVTSNAAVAGAAAIASTAAIPIIGPELAPAAGAAAFSSAMAFAPLASARGGWGDVPFDGAMTELHKNEMVLPADIATPLRQQLKGGPSGGGGGGFAPSAANDRGGDTHIHIHAMDTQSIAKFARDNGHHFAAGVKKAVRDGWRG